VKSDRPNGGDVALYHNAMSTCSAKVRIALAEKSLRWTGHELDLRAGDSLTPAYLKINPDGVVPTLLHAGQIIRESTVIVEYLDEAFDGPPLRPDNPVERARMRLWTKALDEGLHSEIGKLSQSIAFRFIFLAKGPEAIARMLADMPDKARRAARANMIEHGVGSAYFPAAIRAWAEAVAKMDAALAEHAWLAGETFSAADIGYAPYIVRLDHLGLASLWAERPAFRDWFARLGARPSFGEGLERWLVPGTVTLMRDKGQAAWPDIARLLAAERPATSDPS